MSKKTQGFTLLELIIAITIVGIISTTVTFSIGQYIREKKSEQYVVGFFNELRSIRARAIKDHERYVVKLDLSAQNGDYFLFMDSDNDYLPLADKSDRIRSSFMMGNKSSVLEFALPNPYPSPLAASGYPLSSATAGEWQKITKVGTAGKVTVTNAIFFKADDIGTITNGVLYLRNTTVPKVGYAIVKASNSNELKLYKWSGNQWYEM